MKRFGLFLVSLLILTVVFSFFACAEGDVGHYAIVSLFIGEDEYDLEELTSHGMNCYYIDLKEDGTAEIQVTDYFEGQWENGLIYTEDSTVEYFIEDDILLMADDEQGIAFFFQKQTPEEFAANHSDAGYYVLEAAFSGEEEYSTPEELEAIGFDGFYINLMADGKMDICTNEELHGTWVNGTVTYDGYLNSYYMLENDLVFVIGDDLYLYFARQE